MIEIRAAVPADINGIVELLSLAFEHTVLYRYFEPDAAKRLDFLRMVFRLRLEHCFDASDVELACIRGEIAGGAVWIQPDAALPPNTALDSAVREYNPAVFERWRRFHELLFPAFDAVCSEPHWSLAPVAVRSGMQRRGVGGALIRRKLPEIDGSGAPCMLGTQDEANAAIYERYGWKTARRVPVSEDFGNIIMIRRV